LTPLDLSPSNASSKVCEAFPILSLVSFVKYKFPFTYKNLHLWLRKLGYMIRHNYVYAKLRAFVFCCCILTVLVLALIKFPYLIKSIHVVFVNTYRHADVCISEIYTSKRLHWAWLNCIRSSQLIIHENFD